MLRLLCLLLIIFPVCAQVKVWEDTITVPTYVVGPPDPNPFFYTGRTYQGARGEVYPYPMYDKLSDRLEDKTYKALWLENEYVKLCVLPELGGRIFTAVDKTNNYDFFYRQTVVKPALIGMLGAWISGGVEWNVPHHHRASSLLPAEYRTVTNPDGSATIWVGEMELRHRMRWAVGLTLRPGRSTVEATVRVLNTTPVMHSMLYFANVAVHTNENYQVIFPPSTQFVTQHAKREFARWPVADNVYNGIDFSPGTDVSRWKNHPSPISMFAWNYDDDFLAGYDHGKQAGTLHIADHHTVPGKKFFAWGNGPAGRMWDNILSDKDGPYLELMVGAYSDNQPDYSWLQPYETREVRQTWYPFRNIGGVKNANEQAAVNIEKLPNGKTKLGFYVTQPRPQAIVRVTAGGKTVFEAAEALDPGKPFLRELDLPAEGVRAALIDAGQELVAYEILPPQPKAPLPPAVEPPPPPDKVKSVEELYLTGLRLEQFHNPALDPDPYYQEALRRDSGDARANTALGRLDLMKGRYPAAVSHLQAAVDRVSANYTRPLDGAPDYYLGLALRGQEKYKDAVDHLQRATWNYAFSSAAYFNLAEIASLRGDRNKALEYLDRSLVTNQWNTRALSLKSVLLMLDGKMDESAQLRARIRAIDPLDLRGSPDQPEVDATLNARSDETLEMAASLINAGLWRQAIWTLGHSKSPLARYYEGWVYEQMGRKEDALKQYQAAAALPPALVFPFQLEVEKALRSAMAANPQDPRAPYYLGNLLYDRQPETAVVLWEKARALDPKLAVVHRNLAVAWSRQDATAPQALRSLETALSLNPEDGLYLFEWDRLAEQQQMPLNERLAMFTKYPAASSARDDVESRRVALLVQTGQYGKAIDALAARHFHLWEGGVRFNASDAWTDAHILRGQQRLAAKEYAGALADFKAALEFPPNLEATRAYRGSRLPEALYFEGVALEALGRKDEAAKAWRESAAQRLGSDENPHPGIDSGAALLYYQGLSLQKLGETRKAKAIFESLIQVGKGGGSAAPGSDFFAKFGERGSARLRQSQAFYIAGLGQLGLNQPALARADFQKAIELNAYHLDARAKLQSLK